VLLTLTHHIHFPSLSPCDKAPSDDSHCLPSNCEPAPRTFHAHQGNHATSCIAFLVLKRLPCKSHPTFGTTRRDKDFNKLVGSVENPSVVGDLWKVEYHQCFLRCFVSHHSSISIYNSSSFSCPWKDPWSHPMFVPTWVLEAVFAHCPKNSAIQPSTQPAWFSYPAKGH